jgi:flagellar hook-associated protein 2
MLQAVGLDVTSSDATKIDAMDASIRLNGVTFTSDTNTFEINGLTISAKKASTEEISLTTEDDTEGIYDLIKEFIEGYNALIVEMDTLSNADSASDYDMLSDDARDEMSETEIEEWDGKIKDALLRNDDTLESFSSIMKSVMLSPIEIDGENVYLSDFGINTLSYFEVEENENSKLHIDGDEDDDNTSGNTDVLSSIISSDPDKLTDFFTQLSRTLYTSMYDAMSRTSLSSMFTVYNDIKMQDDYDDYTTLIAEYEEELTDYEDRYYAKFSAMEVALANMETNSSAISSLLGSS